MTIRKATVAAILGVVATVSLSSPALSAPADRTPPTAPSSITSSLTTETSTILTWSKATDNIGVVGYDVFSTTSSVRLDNTTTSLSIKISNLTPGSTYSYYVRARDKAKNLSAPSPTVTVTTSVPVPPPPPPTWSDCSGGYVALSYDDGPGTGTTALVYKLKEYNIRATWFDVGQNVQANPSLARLQSTQGSVQDHSWDHSSLTGASTGTSPLTQVVVLEVISVCVPLTFLLTQTLSEATSLTIAA